MTRRTAMKLSSSIFSVFLLIAGCGGNVQDDANASRAASTKEDSQNKENSDPLAGFVLSPGSAGNGAVMKELRMVGRDLREPDAKYDVFDTDSNLSPEAIKKNIEASLDSGHQVLIDSDGTPESQAKAAEMLKNAIGASLPDVTAVLVKKVDEKNGGGLGLIPLYTRAEVTEQITQGKINKPEDLNNSVENFFFNPKKE